MHLLLIPIEFLSNIILRPFTLAIRLFANMFAGHMLITIAAVGTLYLLGESGGCSTTCWVCCPSSAASGWCSSSC